MSSPIILNSCKMKVLLQALSQKKKKIWVKYKKTRAKFFPNVINFQSFYFK